MRPSSFSSALDLEAVAEFADQVFCFYDMQGAGLKKGRSISAGMAGQTTWEAFS
jgi:hypothetical protein